MDPPGPLSPSVSIIHSSREVLKTISCIGTELLYIGSTGRPAFGRPCEGVHKSISLMSCVELNFSVRKKYILAYIYIEMKSRDGTILL